MVQGAAGVPGDKSHMSHIDTAGRAGNRWAPDIADGAAAVVGTALQASLEDEWNGHNISDSIHK